MGHIKRSIASGLREVIIPLYSVSIYDIVLVSGFPGTRKILINWSEVSEVLLRRLWAPEHFPGKTKETGFVQLKEWSQEVLAAACQNL